MKKITELTAELAAPAIAEQGCTLWDVEYVKEALPLRSWRRSASMRKIHISENPAACWIS